MPVYKDLDASRQRACYAIRNKYYWYIDSHGKFDPRFDKARIIMTKSGATIALKHFRQKFSDDSIHIVYLALTQQEEYR